MLTIILLYIIFISGYSTRCHISKDTTTRLVPLGEQVKLECPADENGLQVVKWFKDGKEFCRYYPKLIKQWKVSKKSREINTQIFCNGTFVNLGEANFLYDGSYTCRAITKASKQFKVTTRRVSLLVHPVRGPVITGIKKSYKEGEIIQANCTAEPSNPPPVLIWYINGIQADAWSTMTYTCLMTEDDLCVLKTNLKLQATRKLFSKGLASFVCESTILALPGRRAFATSSLITSHPNNGSTNKLHQGLLWILLLNHLKTLLYGLNDSIKFLALN